MCCVCKEGSGARRRDRRNLCVSFTLASSFLHRDAWNDLNRLWISSHRAGRRVNPDRNLQNPDLLLGLGSRHHQDNLDGHYSIPPMWLMHQGLDSYDQHSRHRLQPAPPRTDNDGVFLLLWRPLFSIVTRGMTWIVSEFPHIAQAAKSARLIHFLAPLGGNHRENGRAETVCFFYFGVLFSPSWRMEWFESSLNSLTLRRQRRARGRFTSWLHSEETIEKTEGRKWCVSFTLASSFLNRDTWNDLNRLWISSHRAGRRVNPEQNPDLLLGLGSRHPHDNLDGQHPSHIPSMRSIHQDPVSYDQHSRHRLQPAPPRTDNDGVSLLLWRPLFSIVTHGMTWIVSEFLHIAQTAYRTTFSLPLNLQSTLAPLHQATTL